MIKLLLLLGVAAAGWAWLRASRGAMTVGDATALLGVGRDADPTAIREAHRRLMQRVHPDAGGTDELAARINHARDTLLAVARQADPRQG